ncbi:MAG: hypothetical protein GX782_01780 [Gammaproteobacteria bacterium]|nr:hypothetical protein [Gammaproteobacteria bacterium]
MMRKIFILVVVANILFFIWMMATKQETGELTASNNKPVRDENTLSIVLLKEVHEPKTSVIQSSDVDERGRSLLGGFDDEERAVVLLQRLMSLNIGGEIVERISVINTEYRVYIPAGESKRLALRMIDELLANKIDAALVENGVVNNVIMLGSFPQESAASRQVEYAQALGYQAEVKRIIKKRHRFWVSINAEGQRLLDAQVIRTLKDDFAELEHVQE